jgi:hypothetical protein
MNVVVSFIFWELHGGTFPNLTVVGLKFEPVLNSVSAFEKMRTDADIESLRKKNSY